MRTKEESIITLSIEELLNGNDNYVIPIYQRNYAWGEGEIAQLIQDIIDYIPVNGEEEKNYYLGTLIVFERLEGNSIVFETIDGQQRLTTLSLLVSVIKNKHSAQFLPWFKKMNLDFVSRKESSDTLASVFADYFPKSSSFNENIINGYELSQKLLKVKLAENNILIETFTEFLIKNVKILRVSVPMDTELNHYFEIMNSRGEQLEKHEILKAKFLEVLNDLDQHEKQIASAAFNLIWEACSNMEKYVQYGFSTGQRDALFGKDDWNQFALSDFDDITKKLKESIKTNEAGEALSISKILEGKVIIIPKANTEEQPERFNSVINFPNFLLHVLRVQTKKDIPLDDKRLIPTFEEELNKIDDKINFVKEFSFYLLRSKFLFDQFIIKREYIAGTDRWSLKKLKWYEGNKVSYVNSFGEYGNSNEDDENRTALMLLSMFHVSTPTLVYKHWLNAALYFLNNQYEVEPNDYINYLESIAKAFVFDRFIAKSDAKDYYDIIYQQSGQIERSTSDLDFDKLKFGNINNNLVFNYLDYLLWQKYKKENPNIKSFEYSFRSSVEHYYPQTPLQGFAKLDEKYLHSFGNLCLITHSKNSRLNNLLPSGKIQYYNQGGIDSIKQYIMMTKYDVTKWGPAFIEDHDEKMKIILTSNLNSETSINSNISDKNKVSKALRWFYDYQETNPNLLVRALLCFGDITEIMGSALAGEKWNFYNWSEIKKSESFKSYEEYVELHNPINLKAIIENQLREKPELREDAFCYIFVLRPELLDFCEEGNIGWLNDGNKILLMSGEKVTPGTAKELNTFLLEEFIESKYDISVLCDPNEMLIALDFIEEEIILTDYTSDAEVYLQVWNEEGNEIKYSLEISALHGNSKFSKRLKELGWDPNDEGETVLNNKSILVELGEDYEEDFNLLKRKFVKLVKNGLKIRD